MICVGAQIAQAERITAVLRSLEAVIHDVAEGRCLIRLKPDENLIEVQLFRFTVAEVSQACYRFGIDERSRRARGRARNVVHEWRGDTRGVNILLSLVIWDDGPARREPDPAPPMHPTARDDLMVPTE